MAGRFRLATALWITLTQEPFESACAQMTPSGTLFSGASAVSLIEISPVLLTEKECDEKPWGFTSPVNDSIWFLEGSTMPPQLIVIRPATSSARTDALGER